MKRALTVGESIVAMIEELPDEILRDDEIRFVYSRPPGPRSAPAPDLEADGLSAVIKRAWRSSRYGEPTVVAKATLAEIAAREQREADRRVADLAAAGSAPLPTAAAAEAETADEKVARITAELSPHVKTARSAEREAAKLKRKEPVR